MTYINAVKYIRSLPDLQSNTGSIERMRIICNTLGNPQKKLKALHVCGDVGKDSCITMLGSVLKNTSHSFGRCSLTNLYEPRECIFINGNVISHFEFADIVKVISKAYKSNFNDITPSQSEVITIAATVCFANNGCEIAIFERTAQKNDPASTTELPIVSLLTPFFERDITDGRFEHLISKGTLETVSSPQHKETYSIISDACVLAGSRLTVPIYSDMEIKNITLFKTEFSYRGENYSIRSFSPYQTVNAITVIEAINSLIRCGFQINAEEVKKGLFSAGLDGKCETISIEPTVIVSTVFEKNDVDTLVASLSQVKSQFSKQIDVYVEPGCEIDLTALSASLASYEIPHNPPVSLSVEDASKLLSNASSLTAETALILIGDKNYIYKAKIAFNNRLVL